PQGEKDFLGLNSNGLPIVLKAYFLVCAGAAGIKEFCAGVKLNALPPQYFFDFAGRVGIEFRQNASAALDLDHPDTEADEELGEFNRNRTASENDERLWKAG